MPTRNCTRLRRFSNLKIGAPKRFDKSTSIALVFRWRSVHAARIRRMVSISNGFVAEGAPKVLGTVLVVPGAGWVAGRSLINDVWVSIAPLLTTCVALSLL